MGAAMLLANLLVIWILTSNISLAIFAFLIRNMRITTDVISWLYSTECFRFSAYQNYKTGAVVLAAGTLAAKLFLFNTFLVIFS